jgi:integrase
MRKPMTFTTRAIDQLELEPGETDVWIWEADSTGLGVRMRAGKGGTSKVWYCAYRFAGQDRRDRLADLSAYTLADARHRAYELRRAAADGADPRAAKAEAKAEAIKAIGCPTFGEYAEHYLRRKEKDLSPATYREAERYLAAGPHFAPFKKLRLDQIDKATIAKRINFLEDTGITKPSATVAQKARMSLLALFKLAVSEGLVEENPVLGTRQPAPPKQQKPRERTLTGEELRAVWDATGGDDDHDKIVRLLILTGGRRQEIGGMRWSELDQAGSWTLPAERSKTDQALTLPLPQAALEIIHSIARRDGRDQIFGSSSDEGFSSWSCAKRELDARLPIAAWRVHDLRRTAITGMHELGIEPHVVEAVVNHKPERSVHNRHYNKATYQPQKAAALARWAEHVTGGNVVSLRAA